MSFSIYEIAKQKKFNSKENYSLFYGTMFLVLRNQQKEILRLVMEDDSNMGHIIGLSGVWDAVKDKTPDRSNCRNLMKWIIDEYYEKREVTAADLKKMRSVKDFMGAIGADSYLSDVSVIGKLKNFGGKSSKEKPYTLAGGRTPKGKKMYS